MTLTLLGMLTIIPSPAFACDDPVEVEVDGVPDSRSSPRGTFVFGLSPKEVNPDNCIKHEVGPRTDNIWTDLYFHRDSLFESIGLPKSSLLVNDNPAQVLPGTEAIIVRALDHAHQNSNPQDRLSLVENAATFYSYRSYFQDFSSLSDIHLDNWQSYSRNQLNSAMYRSIENSTVFSDPNFRPENG